MVRTSHHKNFYQILVISILALFISPVISPASAQGTDVLVSDTVEDHLIQIVEDGEIPTIQVGIIEDGELRYAKGFGAQTSLDNVFPIGSIQKMFVAMAILQLYDDGLIDLDADVNDYLPFSLVNPNYPDVAITPRLLLYHRSGIVREMRYTFCWDTRGVLYPEYKSVYSSEIIGMGLGEFLNSTLADANSPYYQNWIWEFEPDTEYGYSAVGYQILSYLVEIVSGELFSEYVTTNIFEPLDMTHTSFNVSDLEHHATPYIRYNHSNHAVPVWAGNDVIRSNVQDLAKFILVHMNQGRYGDVQILKPETVEMMHEIGSPLGGTPYGLIQRGYGMAIYSYDGDIFGHSGSSVGGISTVFFSPSSQKGLIYISNLNHIGCYDMNDVDFVNEYFYEANEYLLTTISFKPVLAIKEILLVVCISGVVISISYNVRKFWKKRTKTTQE